MSTMNEYLTWGLLGALVGAVLCAGCLLAWVALRLRWPWFR